MFLIIIIIILHVTSLFSLARLDKHAFEAKGFLCWVGIFDKK